MFERYTERARRVLFFARYEASQLGSISIETEHLLLGLIREGKGLTSRIFARSHLSLENIRKEIEGRTVFREKVSTSVEIPFSAETKRVLQFAAEEADRLLHNYIGTEHLLLGHPARGALGRGVHPHGKGDAPQHRPRGHRPAPEREDDADARQGNAAARRVQPRPDRSGDEEPARSAGRPRARARARAAGALPPHQEQRRAHRRAGRRQDGHRRRAGAEDRLRRRAALPRRQAHPRARHLADRRRHEVPRSVRRAPQGDHEGADREPEHHRVHRRAAHAGRRGVGRRVARRREHPQAGALARRDPLHRRDDAGRVPEVHREGPLARAPLPGDQGRSAGRARDDRDPAWASRIATSSSITSSTRARRSRRRSTSRAATSPIGSCPTRRSTSWTRPARAPSCARRATARSSARSTRASASPSSRWRARSRRRTSRRRSSTASRKCTARENLQFVREKFDVKSSARKVIVGKAEIDEVVSKWTGVPMASINQDEGDKLLRMEDELHKRVISQEKAISAISRAIRRSRAGLKNPNRPGRQLRVPRPDRRRQDRARARARELPLRQRPRAHPLRHVRVHGEALGLAS